MFLAILDWIGERGGQDPAISKTFRKVLSAVLTNLRKMSNEFLLLRVSEAPLLNCCLQIPQVDVLSRRLRQALQLAV
jgi:hypothetical protein